MGHIPQRLIQRAKWEWKKARRRASTTLAWRWPASAVAPEGIRFFGRRAHRIHLGWIRDGLTEPLTTADLRDAIRSGDTVVDVGAYIGVHTVVAAQAVGAIGQVYSIEPDPIAVKVVGKTLRKSGLDGRVTVIHAAAGDRECLVHLKRRASDPSMNTITEIGGYQVRMVALDDEIENADVVKIDVEGGEMLVLAGMRRLLLSTRVLIVEYAPKLLTDATPEELVERVRSFGFRTMSSTMTADL